MASFFRPHYHYNVAEPNLQGLFRLIDDFDRYAGQNASGHSQSRHSRSDISFFTPKFDLTETDNAYELHGELPGLNKEDIHIEFTDQQTLQIRGKVERTYTAGTPPAELIDGGKSESNGAVTDGVEQHTETSAAKSHQPTVEDDPEEKGSISSSQTTPQDTPASTAVEAVKPEVSKQQAPKHKYYLVERNVGSFARSFDFPGRVDLDSVQASLNNGILTVTVQKAKKPEKRRITVN